MSNNDIKLITNLVNDDDPTEVSLWLLIAAISSVVMLCAILVIIIQFI